MGLLDKLYNISPVCIQNLMCSVKGWQICKRRYNKGFYKELYRYKSRLYKQEEELLNMLLYVKDMSVYAPYIKDINLEILKQNPSEIYKVLQRFPIINKFDVKNNIDGYTNYRYEGRIMEMRTSGTTGGGLVFPYSVDMENKQWAIWWRYRVSLGIKIGTWCGWFGGKVIVPKNTKKAPFWRVNSPGRQVMFSSFHLTTETVISYYNEVKTRKLTWLHGYPSHVSRFAAFILDAALEPLRDVKFVTTGAENVLGNQVEVMKQAFPNAIIRQHYGLNEGVANISQDKNGEWIVDDDFCYVEFVPTGNMANQYHIIGTGFSNLALPLVRYDTGDIATIVNGKIVSIDGRTSNVIKQPSGHDICEASLSIVLHDFGNITEAQFHQKSLTEVELWVVKGKLFTDTDEQQLWKNLNNAFEKELHVTVKYVDSVERTKAGKLKLVISEINKSQK